MSKLGLLDLKELVTMVQESAPKIKYTYTRTCAQTSCSLTHSLLADKVVPPPVMFLRRCCQHPDLFFNRVSSLLYSFLSILLHHPLTSSPTFSHSVCQNTMSSPAPPPLPSQPLSCITHPLFLLLLCF